MSICGLCSSASLRTSDVVMKWGRLAIVLMSGVHLESQSWDIGHSSCSQRSQGCGRRTEGHEALTGAGGRALTFSSFTWPEVCRPCADNRQQG